jgi:hypothetical protein
MTEERKRRADERLTEALAAGGLADTRPVYRQVLRRLRETHPAAFEKALRHYDEVVLAELGGTADAVETWIAYGAWLADLTAEGRVMSVREDGRSVEYRRPYASGDLVLHIPGSAADPVLPLMLSAAPSPAQQATYDLLVAGRVSLG